MVLGDIEVVDMGSTHHAVPTHGESGGDKLGAAGAASHDELPTWVMGSGTLTRPWGPGGVSGAALMALLTSVIAWTEPPMQCPQFAFRCSKLVAKKNLELLCWYSMDLDMAFMHHSHL